MRKLILLGTTAALAGCGLGDTATTAAVTGKSKSMQIEQVRAAEQRATVDIDKAAQQAEQRLKGAEAK